MYHSTALREKTDRTNADIYIYTLNVQADGEPIIPHWHRETEIIYCACSGTAYVDNLSFVFKENDIIWVNKNELHNIKADSDGTLYCYLFDYQYLDFKVNDWCSTNIIAPLDETALLLPNMIDTSHPMHSKIKPLLFEILRRYKAKTQGGQMKIKALLYELFFEMYSNGCILTNGDTTNPQTEYVKTIISYMNEKINEDVDLDDISKKTHLSKGYIINLFKSVIGQTPMVYLRNLRLEYATELLKNGKTVTEAACLCGIPSVSYFIREYKKKYGTTPKKHCL